MTSHPLKEKDSSYILNYFFLVLEAMYRSRNTSSSVYESIATETVDWHNRSIPQKTSELYSFAHSLSYNRNYTDSCCLLVYHSYGCLIGYHTCNRCSRCITTHVMASSFSIVRAPATTASIIPWSSLTGINAPLRPPTYDDAITPPFLT